MIFQQLTQLVDFDPKYPVPFHVKIQVGCRGEMEWS